MNSAINNVDACAPYYNSISNNDTKEHIDSLIHWCETVNELFSEYLEIDTKRKHLLHEINHVIEITQKLKVPYCYEYLRISFETVFNDCKTNIILLEESMMKYPNNIEIYYDMAKENANNAKSKDNLTLLDIELKYFKARCNYLEEYLNTTKAKGEFLYHHSQIIPKNGCFE
jgi:hypothetical protein